MENPAGNRLLPHEVPQHAYAADPGTITGWVVSGARGSTLTEELQYVALVMGQFDELPQDRAAAAYQERVADMISAVYAEESLCPFLTVTTFEGQDTAVVSVISRLGKYAGRLGDQVGGMRGKTFGYFGEVDATTGQLPTLLQLPEDTMAGVLIPSATRVPTAASVAAQYLATTAAGGTMAKLITVQAAPEMATELNVPKLQLIPTTWAPYFIGMLLPEAALRTMQQLVAGLETEQLKVQMAPLVNWCLVACVRAGAAGAPKRRSMMDIRWVTPVLAGDRQVVRWMSARLAAYRSPTAATPVLGHAIPPPGPLAAALAGPTAGTVAAGAKETKEYSPYEKNRIRLGCGLVLGHYAEADFPPIYAMMLVEGRTLPKVEAVLQNFLTPTVDELDPVKIYVSPELVRDVKELRYGYDNDLSFENCHRGISPFCVMAVTVENQAKRRRLQERAERATFLSTTDVQIMEEEPGQCPTTYHGMRELLRRYIKLLDTLFLPTCAHAIEVRALFQELGRMVQVYESLAPAMVVELLWQIFIDARAFFSDTGPEPTKSELALVRYWVKTCSPKTSVNCPVARLLGGGVATPTVASGHTSRGGGSTADSSVSTLGASYMSPAAASRSVSGRMHVNPTAIPEIVAIMGPFKQRKPGVGMRELMRVEKQAFNPMLLGPRGTCMDYMYMGECVNAACTYNHSPPEGITASPALVARLKKLTDSNLQKG